MKSKTLILLVVAIVCGLAASYMTSQLLAERNNTGPEQTEEKIQILVAKKNLPRLLEAYRDYRQLAGPTAWKRPVDSIRLYAPTLVPTQSTPLWS